VVLFISCPPAPERLKTVYPSDIAIPGAGTLKYTGTLWDGADIYEGQKIGNEIWITAYNEDDYNVTLFKGIDKTASVPIVSTGIVTLPIKMLPKGDYINFLTSKAFITRVHKATMDKQRFRISMDGRYGPWACCGNDEVFFYTLISSNTDAGYYYYMLNEACDNVIEITQREFLDRYVRNPGYVKDDEGRCYRLFDINNNDRVFEVSVDNRETWHRSSIGTNWPSSIILQNDSVYVLCGPIDDLSNNPPIPVGGGIHEFKWETKSGEE